MVGGTWARVAAPLLVLVYLLACASPAPAATDDLTLEATVDGRDVADAGRGDPIRLDPDEPVEIHVRVQNRTDREVEVRNVRLAGGALGLTLFAFTTRVDMVVPPAGAEDRRFELDLTDLRRQASGLLAGRMVLLDADHERIGSRAFSVDVRGSLLTVYGVFGLIVAAATAGLLGAALVRLANHRLSDNRAARAVRFGIPGIGLGLTVIFTLSALRILLPTTRASLLLILAGAVIGAVFGYLTPYQDDEEDGPLALDDDEEQVLDIGENGAPPPGEDASTLPASSAEP